MILLNPRCLLQMRRQETIFLVLFVMCHSFLGLNAFLLAQPKTLTATGKITAIDLQERTLSFSGKGAGGTMHTLDGGTIIMPGLYEVKLTGLVDENAVIKIGTASGTLKEIHVGDTVTIRYLNSTSSSPCVVKSIKKK